jgi:hypothetical protein
VVECLFKWQDDAKNHFKAKVFFSVILCDNIFFFEIINVISLQVKFKFFSGQISFGNAYRKVRIGGR